MCYLLGTGRSPQGDLCLSLPSIKCPTEKTAITNARRVLGVLWSAGLASSIRAVSPSADGGVGIVFAGSDQKYADIECFNDGEILAITSEGTAEPSVWPLNGEAETLRHAIETISTFLNG